MRILEDNRQISGWITAIIAGRWVEAKVYDQPSMFGVNGGRVSKIAISKTDKRDKRRHFLDQIAYHYDRGLDFCKCPQRIVDKVIAELEALPRSDTKTANKQATPATKTKATKRKPQSTDILDF